MSSFQNRAGDYTARVNAVLETWLPPADRTPARLHRAMRHAVFNGGKRIRPLLAYATGEVLGLVPDGLDPAAAAVELIHCYSLVHDDLPAMDDDDLRRGQPTVHKAFDEATAILAGDALHSLAFDGLTNSEINRPAAACAILARACGSLGMAGGQALDLAFESTRPDRDGLEQMFRLKTGALIGAAVLMAAVQKLDPDDPVYRDLEQFAHCIGVAFQIRDDLLEFDATTEQIGKSADSDQARDKATWPGLFGVDQARARANELIIEAKACLQRLPGDPQPLTWLGDLIVNRKS